MHSVSFSKTGGPEVLEYKELKLEDPKSGEVLIKHAAIGLNFIDTYHRSGLYTVPIPSGIGLEGAGVIEKVGPPNCGTVITALTGEADKHVNPLIPKQGVTVA